jgi:hypothetical protein
MTPSARFNRLNVMPPRIRVHPSHPCRPVVQVRGNAMTPMNEFRQLMTRRHFFGRTATGLGVAALGSLLFAGASSPDAVRVDVAMVAAYTVVHLTTFAIVGVILEWGATRIERAPGMWLMALLTLIIVEGLFLGTVGGLSGWVLGTLGIWAIGIANIAAVAAMGGWLWMSHPRLHEPLKQPVETRV